MNNDLISREEAMGVIKSLQITLGGKNIFNPEAKVSVLSCLEAVPTVDAEPVRRGLWLPTNDDNKKRCNQCDVIHLIAQYPHGQANYCPNCGAKMDGGVDNVDN